jgi:formylglycine-generating enzyme required for sulfatase activity
VDKYEASVWETTNANLIRKIRRGTVTLADLLAAGATQHGESSDDYGAGCPDTGNGCVNFYAVSIAGVTPSRYITWFQAAAAARNAGKRLLTNAEWQAAAFGTPDGAPCVVSAGGPGPTGTAGCVSDVGVFDMVGNLHEWVDLWLPQSTTCLPSSLYGTNDINCIAGASTNTGPGAVIRQGSFASGAGAGVFGISATDMPTHSSDSIGFRAGR